VGQGFTLAQVLLLANPGPKPPPKKEAELGGFGRNPCWDKDLQLPKKRRVPKKEATAPGVGGLGKIRQSDAAPRHNDAPPRFTAKI
jgi:hypothetical protein